MRVIETEGRLRFIVQSTSQAGEDRMVDMCEFQGNGQCSCWKFAKMMRGPLEQHVKEWRGKKGSYIPEERYRCEHIREVVNHIANCLVQSVRAAYPDDNQGT